MQLVTMEERMVAEILSRRDMEMIHQATLEVLEAPGMRVMSAELLDALEREGARVDRAEQMARFPGEMIENCLAGIREEVAAGRELQVINGVVSSRGSGGIQAKFGGACINYYDQAAGCVREPTYQDMVAMIRLGDALPEVGLVGNPVLVQRDEDGAPIDPRLRTVKGAALVAQHTSKPGSTEVWSSKELDYLVRIGCVVRGGEEAYRRDPAFITAKETIAPLTLPDTSTDVFMALALRDLPCTIIPMPMSGVSSPVTAAGNIVVGNAEILGAMAAIRAFKPGAPVSAGVISGILDMATGSASFSAPEAILQDLGFSRLWTELYGLGCAIGTGYIDAKCPGVQAGIEKELKIMAAAGEGHCNHPVGILDRGKTFCPEQAMLDLEVARYVTEYLAPAGIEVSREALGVEVIRNVGVGGSFIGEEHTVANFRQALWFPELFDRSESQGFEADRDGDMAARAHERWREVLAGSTPYSLSNEQAEEIEAIVAEAAGDLLR